MPSAVAIDVVALRVKNHEDPTPTLTNVAVYLMYGDDLMIGRKTERTGIFHHLSMELNSQQQPLLLLPPLLRWHLPYHGSLWIVS